LQRDNNLAEKIQREWTLYYVMRSKNEVLCAAAGRLAAERSEFVNNLLSRKCFTQST
jgi:hypothetical protein